MHRRSLLTGMLTTAGLSLLGKAQASTMDGVRQQGFMRIATTGANAPYSFLDADGELSGFDIDWSRLICKGLGVEARFSYLSWPGILPGLMAGQYDSVMSAVRVTPERKENFVFSAPYATDSAAVIVRTDNTTIHEVEDLHGLTVGVASGSILEDVAHAQGKPGTLRSYPGLPDIIMDVMSGRLDAGIVGRGGAQYAIKAQQVPLKLVGRSIDPHPLAMILPPGSETLAATISDQIRARQADGQAKSLFDHWFGA
ncbi:amino acid ABC transporter [Gluconobacter kanchanaburiensis NBRC 103587]|uniref:Amino acid ABC transporter n=2 Tax=Gluconobacter kanchanaburiensis TaxID=563199 RepID=A0A511B7K7_9PROT|nr:extracellular solute-binding protein [Gluconobacter kanchanaburiensis NBRC 103587]GEK96440.1 amino acid ABC transporter [Gluconobacter kanchanaburiensis NBRC 103587]